MRRVRILLCALVTTLEACDVAGPVKTMDLGDRHGTPVSLPEEGDLGDFVWTTDGRELVYRTAGTVVAWEAESGTRRVVLEVQGPRFRPWELTMSFDGRHLYYRAERAGAEWASLWRVPLEGGPGELLPSADTVGIYLLSPDNRHLVYQLGIDARQEWPVWLYEIGTGLRTNLNWTLGVPLAFSPDGRRLLYAQVEGPTGQRVVRILTLQTGASEIIDLGIPLYKGVLWDSDGIHVLMWTFNSFQVRDLNDGVTRTLYVSSFDGTAQFGYLAPDRSRGAFWISKCVKYEQYMGTQRCTAERVALYAFHVPSRQEFWIAGGASGGEAAFSPDGRQIAYRLDGRLYVSAVQ